MAIHFSTILTSLLHCLILGYSGVYSSFLLHTLRVAVEFNVGYRDVLVKLGRRKTVGGQEDWIIEVCAEMAGVARGRQA